ncbi:MAG: ester cyclase [Chitinophagaceae bacterium]|nr:ester cyclase [Chitinophagaceae bacterium]
MNKLLLSAAVTLLLTACEQKPDNASSYPTGSDSSAVVGATSAEEKEERNKETALASARAIATGNMDSVLKDVTADVTDYGDGGGDVIKNKDTLTTMLKSFATAFPDWKGDNLMAAADGDYVYVYGDWSGTFKNDFMGMKATGKPFKFKDVDIFKFNDQGKIIEHRSIQKFATMMEQIGAQPSKK